MTNQRFEQLFAATVAERGAPYQAARDAIFADGGDFMAELPARQSSPEWRVAMQSEILLGWVANRPLYVSCREILDGKLPGKSMKITGKFTLEEHIAALVAMGPGVSPCLIETVLKQRPLPSDVRARAMGALRELRHRFLKQVSLLLLSDEGQDLQMSAASTLALFPEPEVTEALLSLLRDPQQPAVSRASAARALGKHPADRSAGGIREVLANATTPYEVRSACLEAIVELKDKTAVPTILDVAQHTKDDQLLLECVSALGKLGDLSAVPFLRSAKSHALPLVREEAEMALDNLNAP